MDQRGCSGPLQDTASKQKSAWHVPEPLNELLGNKHLYDGAQVGRRVTMLPPCQEEELLVFHGKDSRFPLVLLPLNESL